MFLNLVSKLFCFKIFFMCSKLVALRSLSRSVIFRFVNGTFLAVALYSLLVLLKTSEPKRY